MFYIGAQEFFFNLNNPILFSVLFSLALLCVIYIFYVHIIIPLNNAHHLEKENIELRTAKQMAMFSELDPEPVFRINTDGQIILANQAGKDLCGKENIDWLPVCTIFPVLNNYNLQELISSGIDFQFSAELNNCFFDIILKGVPDMHFAQIYCNNITERKKIEDELIQYQANLRELSKRIQKLQEEEKQKLSRELHDSFGQKLTSLKLNIELLKNGNSDFKNKHSIINDINVLLDSAMTEVREISYKLKPRVLDDFGLIPSLRSLCNDISKQSGIKGMFQSYKLEERLNPDVETGLYRITQEALNNMVKHSQANEFSVQLVKHPGFLRLMMTGWDLIFNK
jgi:signal transduction histidine kinase